MEIPVYESGMKLEPIKKLVEVKNGLTYADIISILHQDYSHNRRVFIGYNDTPVFDSIHYENNKMDEEELLNFPVNFVYTDFTFKGASYYTMLCVVLEEQD